MDFWNGLTGRDERYGNQNDGKTFCHHSVGIIQFIFISKNIWLICKEYQNFLFFKISNYIFLDGSKIIIK